MSEHYTENRQAYSTWFKHKRKVITGNIIEIRTCGCNYDEEN